MSGQSPKRDTTPGVHSAYFSLSPLTRIDPLSTCSTVGEGATCRVHTITGSWFEFPAQANQAEL